MNDREWSSTSMNKMGRSYSCKNLKKLMLQSNLDKMTVLPNIHHVIWFICGPFSFFWSTSGQSLKPYLVMGKDPWSGLFGPNWSERWSELVQFSQVWSGSKFQAICWSSRYIISHLRIMVHSDPSYPVFAKIWSWSKSVLKISKLSRPVGG